MFNNILRDPVAVTPWFHETGANSDWYDFVYMILVRKSDWHEVFTWNQPSLRIHFTCVYYPPAWNASTPLFNCACSKQISQTGFVWTQFMFTWFPSLISDRCESESFVSAQQLWSVKPTWDDNYFILASHFIPPSCKQKQALVCSWSEVVPA